MAKGVVLKCRDLCKWNIFRHSNLEVALYPPVHVYPVEFLCVHYSLPRQNTVIVKTVKWQLVEIVYKLPIMQGCSNTVCMSKTTNHLAWGGRAHRDLGSQYRWSFVKLAAGSAINWKHKIRIDCTKKLKSSAEHTGNIYMYSTYIRP